MPNAPLPGPASRPTHDVAVRRYRIPMRDGIRLFATAWRPDGDGPFPVVIDYDPYRSSDKRTLERGNWFHWLACHGYVVAHLNVRGTDGSEGTVSDEYVAQEQEDGYDAIEWLAAQPWCNGSLGMMGTSYAGFTALQVAMLRPPHLKAILPLFATDDRYTDDVHYIGGALHAMSDLPTWATMMVCLNALPPHESLGQDYSRIWQTHLEGNEPYPFNWLAHQTDGPYWRHGSLRPDYDKIECAVYIVGGWMDAYRNATARILQNLSSPKKAIIGPWEHVFPDWGWPGPAINFMDQAIRWFDHWLKGLDTGIMDEPPLTIYMQEYDRPHRTRTRTSGYWRAEKAWPSGGELKLRLGPHGALAASATGDGSDSFAYRATLGTANRIFGGGPHLGLAEDQRPDELYSLVYTSEPFKERLEIVGWPRATLLFASTAPVVNVVCKLCDVAPDGTSALIAWGALNATHRNSHANPEPLTPGERCEINVPLDVTAWAFDPGHRIRLDVSSADWPNLWPSPCPAENTVWHGSTLTLPIAPTGRPEDARDLGQTTMSLDRYVMRAPPPEMRIIRDPVTGRAWFDFTASEHGELPDEDIALKYDYQSSFMSSDRDPAHASLATEHNVKLTRRGSMTAAQTHGKLESTVNTFHLSFDLLVCAAIAVILCFLWSVFHISFCERRANYREQDTQMDRLRGGRDRRAHHRGGIGRVWPDDNARQQDIQRSAGKHLRANRPGLGRARQAPRCDDRRLQGLPRRESGGRADH
ncbi:MAG: CocE/NonD family hydrolase [Chloroflexi bacterium]|nr:CocE/NonD family hydrolase [Chloroflexota bacterium]